MIINKIIMIIIMLYILIVSIGCSPVGCLTCKLLDIIGIDSQIAIADVEGKDSYSHVYIIINNQSYEPRYLGLYLQDNIDYDNPYAMYDSYDDYIYAGYSIFPDITTIINSIIDI